MVKAKAELRQALKTQALQVADREAKTNRLHQQLKEFLPLHPGLWGTYASMPGEISLSGLHQFCPAVQFTYPRIVGSELEFWQPGAKGFVAAGPWGILEPVIEEASLVPLTKMTGFLVPGLGFDKRGVRLGWGKGYYDRALSQFSGLKVGITFAELVQVEIPCESHDVRMDMVITELGILKAG